MLSKTKRNIVEELLIDFVIFYFSLEQVEEKTKYQYIIIMYINLHEQK